MRALKTLLVVSHKDSRHCQKVLDPVTADKMLTVQAVSCSDLSQAERQMVAAAEHVFCLDQDLPFTVNINSGYPVVHRVARVVSCTVRLPVKGIITFLIMTD